MWYYILGAVIVAGSAFIGWRYWWRNRKPAVPVRKLFPHL